MYIKQVSFAFPNRLISNFEHEEGASTSVKEIMERANEEKENLSLQINEVIIGKALKELWGNKIPRVKRGPRQYCSWTYLNLLKKKLQTGETQKSQLDNLSNFEITLPEGWQRVVNSERDISFIKYEPWFFNEQRGSTELNINSCATDDGSSSISFTVRTHGCKTTLNINKVCTSKDIVNVLAYIENSSRCPGIVLSASESLMTTSPHISGSFHVFKPDEIVTQEVRFVSFLSVLFLRHQEIAAGPVANC